MHSKNKSCNNFMDQFTYIYMNIHLILMRYQKSLKPPDYRRIQMKGEGMTHQERLHQKVRFPKVYAYLVTGDPLSGLTLGGKGGPDKDPPPPRKNSVNIGFIYLCRKDMWRVQCHISQGGPQVGPTSGSTSCTSTCGKC